MSLVEKLTVEPTRGVLVKDCVKLLDDEVKGKGGLSGIAVKGAYALVKAVKPGFVTEVVNALLDDWLKKLQPVHDEWQRAGGGQPFGAYLVGRKDDVAERLLQVTDERSTHTKSGSVKKAYEKLRPSAKRHVEDAIPGLGRVVESHLK